MGPSRKQPRTEVQHQESRGRVSRPLATFGARRHTTSPSPSLQRRDGNPPITAGADVRLRSPSLTRSPAAADASLRAPPTAAERARAYVHRHQREHQQ